MKFFYWKFLKKGFVIKLFSNQQNFFISLRLVNSFLNTPWHKKSCWCENVIGWRSKFLSRRNLLLAGKLLYDYFSPCWDLTPEHYEMGPCPGIQIISQCRVMACNSSRNGARDEQTKAISPLDSFSFPQLGSYLQMPVTCLSNLLFYLLIARWVIFNNFHDSLATGD